MASAACFCHRYYVFAGYHLWASNAYSVVRASTQGSIVCIIYNSPTSRSVTRRSLGAPESHMPESERYDHLNNEGYTKYGLTTDGAVSSTRAVPITPDRLST